MKLSGSRGKVSQIPTQDKYDNLPDGLVGYILNAIVMISRFDLRTELSLKKVTYEYWCEYSHWCRCFVLSKKQANILINLSHNFS